MAKKSYVNQPVKRRSKSRLPERVQEVLIRQFVARAKARTAPYLVGVNRHTATLYFHKFRGLIASKFEKEPWLSVEVEVDERVIPRRLEGLKVEFSRQDRRGDLT